MFYERKHSSNKDFIRISDTVNENFKFPLHFHENCEFIYVEDGALRIGINGVDFDVREGEGAFILPNQPHEFFTPESSRSWVVIFSLDHIPYIKNIISSKSFFDPVIRPEKAGLHECLLNAKSNPFRLRSELYGLAALYAEGKPSPELMMEGGDIVCRVVEYIDAHYTEPMTLESMSQSLGYSYRYMSGIVNKFFKTSLPKVVNKYRVNYACELLSDKDKSVTEIALLCGFGSIRNFNRSFKEILGESPQEYRAKH